MVSGLGSSAAAFWASSRIKQQPVCTASVNPFQAGTDAFRKPEPSILQNMAPRGPIFWLAVRLSAFVTLPLSWFLARCLDKFSHLDTPEI